jgi:hypothetical protein
MYFYETKKENHVPNETESEWLFLSHFVYFLKGTHICEGERRVKYNKEKFIPTSKAFFFLWNFAIC